jgi:hypothetical protein
MHMRVFVLFLFLIVAALPVPAFADDCLGGTATNDTNYTFSTRTIYHTTNVAVSQRVDTFSTELVARMQGGPVLYDQTFNAALADPAVQAAIVAAKGVLTANGAASITGPTLLTGGTSLVGSIPQTGDPVVTATNVSVATTLYVGPQTIMIGDNQSQSFTLLAGQSDYDTLMTSTSTRPSPRQRPTPISPRRSTI